MAGDATFLVDEFLEALVAQLDHTQDALAFKAVNRPLTYAIKDFNLQLQVFVDLDAEGNVRLRSSGPNEAGASTMTIGLTTITRPAIAENTVSLSATRAPSLADAGFEPAERKRLERLGVSNTAQLRRLGSSTGTGVMSRLTAIPVDRLRTALQFGQPQINVVRPFPTPPQPGPLPAAGPAPTPAPLPVASPGLVGRGGPILGPGPLPLIRLAPDTSQIHLIGQALATDEGMPEILLNGRPVAASEAEWDRVVVPIPADLAAGTLEVTLADGTTSSYELARDLDPGNGHPAATGPASEWRPEGD